MAEQGSLFGAATALQRDAVFSECQRYRYVLTRVWDARLPALASIGLNPSTADAERDDNTIRKEMTFARMWGYGGLIKANIFAWRSTDPRAMWVNAADPIGDGNDSALRAIAAGHRRVLCGWGDGQANKAQDEMIRTRENRVRELLCDSELVCFGTTARGHPKHPLYLPYTSELQPWLRAACEAMGEG